jgi:hypothetical protein
VTSTSVRKEMEKVESRQQRQKKTWAPKVSRAWTLRESVSIREGGEDARVGTDLEFGGYSVVKNQMLGVGREPDSCGHTTDGDSSLSGRADGENDVGNETEPSSVHPVRQR